MTHPELLIWLKATHPDAVLRGSSTVLLRDGTLRLFLRAYRGETCTRVVCDEGGEPRIVGSAERKKLNAARRGGNKAPPDKRRKAQEKT